MRSTCLWNERVSVSFTPSTTISRTRSIPLGGRWVNGRVRTRLANNHLVALRLIEFEVVNSGPFFNVFKFSKYSVRVWGWHDQVEIVHVFTYFICRVKRVQIRCIIHKRDGTQSRSLDNTGVDVMYRRDDPPSLVQCDLSVENETSQLYRKSGIGYFDIFGTRCDLDAYWVKCFREIKWDNVHVMVVLKERGNAMN